MSSQESTYTDSTFSEFSSILLSVGDEAKDVDDDVVDLSSSVAGSTENRNLSSILSQIQDDGPAYDESKKRGNLFSLNKNKTAKSTSLSDEKSDRILNNEEKPEEEVPPVSSDRSTLASTAKHSGRKQLFLILSITVVAALVLFNIELRTRFLEQTLNDYNIDLRDSITAQGETFQNEMTKIYKSLKTVQQDLQFIKTDYSDLDSRYHAAAENIISTEAGSAVLIKDLSVLGNEIQALKDELEGVKSQLSVINKTKKPDVEPAASNRLIVDLVSLTNVDKAEELVKKIYEAGFTPSIKKAPYKNKNIYKISVSGFEDLKQAKVFMRDAGKQYGVHNSRLRKS
jgi:hypothetical protein